MWLAAAALGGCVMDEAADTGNLESADSVYQWSEDVQIPNQQSDGQVALAAHGTGLYMAMYDDGTLKVSHFTGSGWSSAQAVPNQLEPMWSPALGDFNGKLTLVYQPKDQNRLVMQTSTDGATWTSPVTAGSSLWDHQLPPWLDHSSPAATVHHGNLYVAYCERSSSGLGAVRVDKYDGTAWTLSKLYYVPTGAYQQNTCQRVALASLPDGRLDVTWSWRYWVTYPSKTIDYFMSHAFAHGTGVTWDAAATAIDSMKTKTGISIATCNGKTHMTHGGYSTAIEIWWTELDPGSGTWYPNVRVPDQASGGGATVGCYRGTRTIMVHNGGYPQLWWSEFGL